MLKKLFVGGIPWETTEEQLRELFGQYGQVESVFIPTDKFTGKPRGFAFVEMSTGEDAEKAQKNLNQTQMGERTIVVNEAQERQERPRGPRSGGYDNDRRGGGGYSRNRY